MRELKNINLNQQINNHIVKPVSRTNREQISEKTLQDLQRKLIHVKKEIKIIKQKLNTSEDISTKRQSSQFELEPLT